jgi:hypothetical protein
MMMERQSLGDFKYFVGIGALGQIATRSDRVCVLNILGGESSAVTPVSHAYSGGNVVFGTSPGRRGQVLATPAGTFPFTTMCAKAWMQGTASTVVWFTCHLPQRVTALPS